MPKPIDNIDKEAGVEFVNWWDNLPTSQRVHIFKNTRGFLKWVRQLRRLVGMRKKSNCQQQSL